MKADSELNRNVLILVNTCLVENTNVDQRFVLEILKALDMIELNQAFLDIYDDFINDFRKYRGESFFEYVNEYFHKINTQRRKKYLKKIDDEMIHNWEIVINGIWGGFLTYLDEYLKEYFPSNHFQFSLWGNEDEVHQIKNDLEFDLFLSHRYYYKFYNMIIFLCLTCYHHLFVYVDWIFDRELNRKSVSKKTLDLLSQRMKQSKGLLFFNPNYRRTTAWMNWEIGHFCALRGGKMGILNLNNYCSHKQLIEVMSSTQKYIAVTSKGISCEFHRFPIEQCMPN